MRIKDEYKKAGYFWLLDKQDKKIPGTITISDGGEIELEVVGLFDESIEALNGKDDLSRIVGHVLRRQISSACTRTRNFP